MSNRISVVGGGLAGCEAAWQLAQAGLRVDLREMKPLRRTPAQTSDRLAELVCSNSFRSANPINAVGLIKQEMQQLDSLVMRSAQASKVPAGDALAVDREVFATHIESAVANHPNIRVHHEIVERIPSSGPVIIATGPLTDRALATDLVRVTGEERLYFYDSIAPIIDADSIDRSVAFEQSRYDKGDGADYLNCPMTESEYDAFYAALIGAECMPLHAFETPKYFQGCMPVEVVAGSGKQSLLFGAMKPVGLRDPRTGQRPFAVLQLRKEDVGGRAYNMVGFQTKMKYPEQKRVFRMIPGLQQAEFLRLGAIHRNTFIDSPALLDERLRLRTDPRIRFAGQITGVEGYVESSACGLLVGRLLAAELTANEFPLPPAETALGALLAHVAGAHRLEGRVHEPQNINWGMFPRVEGVKKREQKVARVDRAVQRFDEWVATFLGNRETQSLSSSTDSSDAGHQCLQKSV